MDLTIAIITYNRKSELLRAIESCIDKLIDNTEFIIVDNNSNDGTHEELYNFFSNKKTIYSYYYLESNLGVAGGRNFAINVAHGEYVFFLDDDAVVEGNDFFAKLVSYMKCNSNIVAAGVEIYEPSTDRILKGKTFKVNDTLYNNTRILSYNGGAHILKKDFYDKLLYPQNLVFGSEELYASLIAYKNNKIVAYFNDLRVLHIPNVRNRYYGKKRDMNIILNTFIIRLLCYPICLIPLLYLLFYFRLMKNGILKEVSIKELKYIINQRYDKLYKCRLKISQFFQLVKYVGIKNML